MEIGIGGLFGVLILLADVWAVISVLSSGARTAGKVIWTVVILVLPVLGLLVWLVVGPRASHATP